MSAIHIINGLYRDEGVRCRRRSVRGAITPPDFLKLRASGDLRMRIKTNVLHACGYRDGSACYNDIKGKMEQTTCHRRKKEVPGVCRDCQREL